MTFSPSIAIIGAGPGGLAAALLLARDGHRVAVFERFETPQPVGSGLMLQPTGLAVLAELGLTHRILGLGRRIERLFGRAAPSGRIVLDVRYDALRNGSFGLAVHRAALFATLYDAVSEHGAITLETRHTIAAVEDWRERPTLHTEDGRACGPFDLVVDASGVNSPLALHFGAATRRPLSYGALWASLPWPAAGFDGQALEQRYRAASVMVGVLPIGLQHEGGREQAAFFWSLKGEDFETWRRGDFERWKARVHDLWPETAPLLGALTDRSQLTFARYAHHNLANPVAGRLVAIGDAAHATSPQLGQGANMALLDAQALAVALRGWRDFDDALVAYAAMRRRHVRFYQQLSALFTPFYQSDSRTLPWLRDYLLAPATRLPLARTFVAAMVAGTVLDPRGRLRLT